MISPLVDPYKVVFKDYIRFANNKSKDYYLNMDKWPMEPELPFQRRLINMPEFQEFVRARQIEYLVDAEDNASWELTKEFYANLHGEGEDTQVKIHGVDIDFHLMPSTDTLDCANWMKRMWRC